ncbi:hypothetical protein BH09PLA1_BH09PLA1_31190 [soil metagenome]
MRKSITVSLSHDLPPQEVKRRIENGIAEARVRHGDALKGAQETWTSDDRMDFTARAMGQNISGSVRIEPKVVHVTVSLPMLLAMFASKLAPRIESEGRKMLEKK